MSRNYKMTAAKREQAGKGAARSLRREGKIPAVIYGDKKEPVTITLDSNTINVEYRKGHMYTSLCEMKIDNQDHLVLARDVQLHPVTDIVEHVDFLRVSKTTKIAVFVPVHVISEDDCPALQEKAILNITRHEVEVICIATDIPDDIKVNLAGKKTGDSIRASDAILPAGAKFAIDNRNFTIGILVAPKTAAEEEAVEAAAAADIQAVADAAAAEQAAAAADAEKKEG